MRVRVGAVVAVVTGMFITGCAANSERACDCGPECPVCRENADLACLHVKVTDRTPLAEYQGKTYYFCSPQCRDEFLKNPRKFVGR
jgi:YHS domain-containing protein